MLEAMRGVFLASTLGIVAVAGFEERRPSGVPPALGHFPKRIGHEFYRVTE